MAGAAAPAGGILGPHSVIKSDVPAERFALDLFDRLWDGYRQRVEYVRTYESLVLEQGATFFNDHIALRTLAVQDSRTGISSISRLFEALGYKSAECYNFEDKNLSALYFQHAHPKLPKLFISELKTWELSKETGGIISNYMSKHSQDHINDEMLRKVRDVGSLSPADRAVLLDKATQCMTGPQWGLVELEDLKAVNKESQYGAWVLVHGYSVNHFTSLINSHETASLDTIEKTADALAAKGVPMKGTIEGEVGSSLRQTATEAVMIDVPVLSQGKETKAPWSYAYFELAQRDPYTDPATGKLVRNEGFMSNQATNLFEMTRTK